jgi:adenylate cyclase
MKNTLIKAGIAFMLSLLLSWVYLYNTQTLFSIDNKLHDLMFTLRGELPESDNVVIIDIDNKSLSKIGQWPWSRDIISALLKNLTEAKAGIIGLDMVFAEPDKSSPHLLKKKFPQISQQLPNYDQILANTIQHTPVVGGFVFTEEKTTKKHTPLIPATFIEKGLKGTHALKESKGIVINTPLIQNALYSSGFFMIKTNEGGVIRSVPLISKYDNVIYPSLAFEMLRIYTGVNKVYIVGDKNGVAFIKLGDMTIPTENSAEFIVNFRGPKKHFKYLSALDILQKNFNPKDIENKFILLGTSAPGLKDLRYIAFDSTFPGVEVHANVIDNILQGDFIEKPFIAKLYNLAIIWGLIFSLMIIFAYITSWLIIPIAISLFLLMMNSFYEILFHYGLSLNYAIPILAFISTLILSIGLDYFFASRQREQARRILGKKVSPSVMQHLLAHANEGLIESKEVDATIFFSDIRDFTTISEQIASPKELIEMLNIYMTPMSDIIMKQQGTIDKFIGDAIMAYWNAPVPVKNHPDLALRAAIQQIEQLKDINTYIYKNYAVNIHIGIGLHTGLVTAGDMGSEGRSDYTIIGDNVNLASRIEGLTRLYGVEILISEETYKQLKGRYKIRFIDIVAVKGKTKSVKIYQVFPQNSAISEEEFHTYNQAIHFFQDNHIKNAYTLFNKLSKMNSCKLYTYYMERCKQHIDNPTHVFSPIAKMTHK